MTVRVVVVDDDDITRTGVTVLLRGAADIDVVASITHADALDRPTWDDCDVAVVDASDRRRRDDQFPGVDVVRSIRSVRDRRQTRVVVLTGVLFDDVVRRRMREAGADYYFHRSTLVQTEELHRAVLAPSPCSGIPEPQDLETLDRLGVTEHTAVNEAVDAARAEGLLMLDPSLARRGRPRSRRRQRFNERADLTPRNADGTTPDREQTTPSLPQIDRFLRWATRVRDRQV